mgnify:CR=1 FL=1
MVDYPHRCGSYFVFWDGEKSGVVTAGQVLYDTGASGAAAVSAAVAGEGVINLTNAEKAWVYTADGKLVKFVKGNPTTVEASAGVYLVKMQNGNIIRSAKVVVK